MPGTRGWDLWVRSVVVAEACGWGLPVWSVAEACGRGLWLWLRPVGGA